MFAVDIGHTSLHAIAANVLTCCGYNSVNWSSFINHQFTAKKKRVKTDTRWQLSTVVYDPLQHACHNGRHRTVKAYHEIIHGKQLIMWIERKHETKSKTDTDTVHIFMNFAASLGPTIIHLLRDWWHAHKHTVFTKSSKSKELMQLIINTEKCILVLTQWNIIHLYWCTYKIK